MKIAIIGMGVVGRAQAELFAGYEQVTYDPATDSVYPLEAVSECVCAVVAVGTPSTADGRADLGAVRSALAVLPPGLPVLLRSTVPPGTTEELRAARLSPVCFCPEFLHEREGGPFRRSADVPFVILGGTEGDRKLFRVMLLNAYGRVRSIVVHECTAAEAELAKYTANLYWATKVTFVNELASISAAFGIEWEKVRDVWLADHRVSEAYTSMQGFPPGFGGRCWPKDLQALIAVAAEAGYQPGFLEAVQDANDRFTHPGDDGLECRHA